MLRIGDIGDGDIAISVVHHHFLRKSRFDRIGTVSGFHGRIVIAIENSVAVEIQPEPKIPDEQIRAFSEESEFRAVRTGIIG